MVIRNASGYLGYKGALPSHLVYLNGLGIDDVLLEHSFLKVSTWPVESTSWLAIIPDHEVLPERGWRERGQTPSPERDGTITL
eukprot:2496743-Amphidinium_carterae.1